MAGENLRWRNIREFLDDLPREHCQIKPDHDFCTVCMRINYLIASSCPLFHQMPKRVLKRVPLPEEDHTEPLRERVTTDDVKHALKGEDFPIIEFAGPRGSGAGAHDEEPIDVEPIDVEPMKEVPPEVERRPKAKPPKEAPKVPPETEEETPKPRPDRDPESIVKEIMDELEFPDEVDLDEEEATTENEKGEGVEEDTEGVEEESEGAEEDVRGIDDREVPGVDEPDDSPPDGPPPKVKKEAVTRRRPKA